MTEQIICSGIYYMETSASISDKGLAFRRSLTEDEEEEIIMEVRTAGTSSSFRLPSPPSADPHPRPPPPVPSQPPVPP